MLVALMMLNLGCRDIDSHQVQPKSDPNILLIMADDMGYGDITSHGNPHIKTPRLDALKKSSVVFQHFYVSPVCAPTRASLLTGKYHQRVGVQSVTNGHEVLDPSAVTMAEWLEERGYRNGIFGKWHLGEYEPSLPLSQGFHEFLGFRTGHTPQYFDAILERNGQNHQTTGYITRALTEAAWSFMRESERPFFCYLPYNVPHTPLQIDTNLIRSHLRKGLSDRTSRIYAMIEHLDHDIGMLLDSLRQEQMLSNTIVIFMSDNGPISGWKVSQNNMRYNAGLRDQKFTTYDGGIRSPSYWMWEGKWPAHPVKDQVTAHIDVLPTLLDVIGMQSVDPTLDGISLRRHLEKANIPSDKRFFFQKYALGTFGDLAPQPGGMVRQGLWKMVNGNELYKLDVDVGEKFNLANKEPAKLDSLNRAYASWWKSIIAECDLSVRPIPIGLEENATTDLQPHHGKVVGDLEYTGHRGLLGERTGTHPQGVDGDWIANWQENGDAITWHILATYDGPYELAVRYRSSIQGSPVRLTLMTDDQKMSSFKLPETEEGWQVQSTDTILLDAGVTDLKLMLEKDVDPGFEVRSLLVRRLKG